MWCFEEALEASKSSLKIMSDSFDKLELGIRFEYDDWQREAYKELVSCPEPLSTKEARRVGLETASKIAFIRELRLQMMPNKKAAVPFVTGLPHAIPSERRIVTFQSFEDAINDGLRTYAQKQANALQNSRRIREEISKLISRRRTDCRDT